MSRHEEHVFDEPSVIGDALDGRSDIRLIEFGLEDTISHVVMVVRLEAFW
jgi:hypothetical protein